MTNVDGRTPPEFWRDLSPEPSIVDALNHAGQRPESGTQDDKRKWSERFANGCAIAMADALRKTALSRRKMIKPVSLAAGTEPLTPLGSSTKKRIDVTVVDPLLGLELGLSLKGFNFKDRKSNNYDKNLTGRLYELGDEVQTVHEHLPHAFMVGILFLPLESTVDKSATAPSSFASAVIKLRARSNRLDPALMMHASRCDAGYIALYSIGEAAVPSGVVRFFDVTAPPPRRGRPRLAVTFSLSELVATIAAKATNVSALKWGEAEKDPLYVDDNSGMDPDDTVSDLNSLLDDDIDAAASGESEVPDDAE